MNQEFRSFCLFMDKYCTPEFIADNPELWYRFNAVKASQGLNVQPQQLEFDFGDRKDAASVGQR